MKEKLVGFMVRNKGMFVKGGLVVGALLGAVVVGAIVLNKVTDPDGLVNAIVEDTLGSDVVTPE